MRLRPSFWAGTLLAAAAVSPGRLFACAACFGQSDSAMAAGMNWGIISLLGMIVVVLGGVAGFFIFLARRAATMGPLPTDAVHAKTHNSWSGSSDPETALDTETFSPRGNLKQAAALAQPRHLCAPVQTPGRPSVPRKRG